MGLTVLNVGDPFAPVIPDATGGGAEQVLTAIDAGLVRAGHTSLVIACDGSEVAGTLLALPRARRAIGDSARRIVHSRVRVAISEALSRHAVDVVHMHGFDFAAYLPAPGVPVVATLHRSLHLYPAEALSPARPDTHLHGVSGAQYRGALSALLLPPIETGVAVDRLHIRVPKRRFAVAMGLVSPEKGFHHAIEAAKQADFQLLVAGQVDPHADHERYFREEIQPRLDARRRFLGPIGFSRKRWILGAARCLLAPSLISETSSLVAMEALAAGTPVVAFPAGALADIVDPGVTGFLVRDAREMADAIADCDRLDPEACRAQARAQHSSDAMTERYLDLYTRLVHHQPISVGAA